MQHGVCIGHAHLHVHCMRKGNKEPLFKMLITNGTRLEYKGLHDLLATHGWELEINLHKEKFIIKF